MPGQNRKQKKAHVKQLKHDIDNIIDDHWAEEQNAFEFDDAFSAIIDAIKDSNANLDMYTQLVQEPDGGQRKVNSLKAKLGQQTLVVRRRYVRKKRQSIKTLETEMNPGTAH